MIGLSSFSDLDFLLARLVDLLLFLLLGNRVRSMHCALTRGAGNEWLEGVVARRDGALSVGQTGAGRLRLIRELL